MTPKIPFLPILCAASVFGTGSLLAKDIPQKPTPNANEEHSTGLTMPSTWTRQGVVLQRSKADKGVSGDPCIVWDEAIKGWRMVLFYDPPGHAQAICTNRNDLGQGQW